MRVLNPVILILLIGSLINGLVGAQAPDEAEYCRRARVFLGSGRYLEASQAAEQALQLNQKSSEGENLFGQAELGLGHPDAAREHLERALALRPELIDARSALGATLLKQGRYRDAQRHFEIALTQSPDDFASLYSLGICLLFQNQTETAVDVLGKAYRLNSSDPALLARLLSAYMKLNRTAEASAVLARLDQALGADIHQRLQVAEMLTRQNAFDLASEEFDRLHRLEPDSFEITYDLALSYHQTGNQDKAAVLLGEIAAKENSAEIQDLLGDVEESRNDTRAAMTAFQSASELEPGNEDYCYDYAQALENNWDLSGALRVFEAGIREFPASTRMWLGLGATYYLAGRTTEAARTLLQAATIAPTEPAVYHLLGLAYDAAGPLQDEIAARFATYIDRGPLDALAYYFAGRILLQRNRDGKEADLNAAHRQLTAAIRMDPSLARAHAELGILLERQGGSEEACRELEIAVRLDPRSSKAYYNLAQVYRKLGNTDKAQEAFAKFQDLKGTERSSLDREEIDGFLHRASERTH